MIISCATIYFFAQGHTASLLAGLPAKLMNQEEIYRSTSDTILTKLQNFYFILLLFSLKNNHENTKMLLQLKLRPGEVYDPKVRLSAPDTISLSISFGFSFSLVFLIFGRNQTIFVKASNPLISAFTRNAI